MRRKNIDPDVVRILAEEHSWIQTDIGKALGASKTTIGVRMRAHGITPAGHPIIPPDQHELIRDLVLSGLNRAQISRKTGYAVHVIRRFALSHNLPSIVPQGRPRKRFDETI